MSLASHWSSDSLSFSPATARRNPPSSRGHPKPPKSLVQCLTRDQHGRAERMIVRAGGDPDLAAYLVHEWVVSTEERCAMAIVLTMGAAGLIAAPSIARYRTEMAKVLRKARGYSAQEAGQAVQEAEARCCDDARGAYGVCTARDDMLTTVVALVCATHAKHHGPVTLYRGIGSGQVYRARKLLKARRPVVIATNPLSSWTEDRAIADDFANDNGGVVLSITADPGMIRLSHRLHSAAFDPWDREEQEVVLHIWPDIVLPDDVARKVLAT